MVWQSMPVVPAFQRLRQENRKFRASLSYIAKPCVKREKAKQNNKTK
jgi:hypothetical protein